MIRQPRVYLAGPDVFLPEPEAWAERKQVVCARYGLFGVTPLDALADEPESWTGVPAWQRIAFRNEAHIRGCDAVIANLTPFRGPSADVGTAFELGFARALGRRVFGYATTAAHFLSRTLEHIGDKGRSDPDGCCWDGDGLLIEQFGLFDNLMLEGAILGSGGLLVTDDVVAVERWRDLAVFERCVRLAAESLAARALSS
jgi:nucleoside 2-deoxyribosyltransferase